MTPRKDFDHRDVPIDLIIRKKAEEERKKQNQEGERATIPTYEDDPTRAEYEPRQNPDEPRRGVNTWKI